MSVSAPFPPALRALGLLWLFLALAVGKLQLLQSLPPMGGQGLILTLTWLLLLAYRKFGPLHRWVDSLDLRTLVALHLTRFVGIWFLVLESRALLPPPFVQVGVGDIIAATLALLICLVPLAPARRRSAVVIWNVIGFIDLVIVILVGARLSLVQPAALLPFTQLPLSLLPTVLVPLLLATHVIIFLRLRNEAENSS